MNEKRLLRLAKRLEVVAPKIGKGVHGKRLPKFDMNLWYVRHLKEDCGTSACAVGYAAILPEFVRQGFSIQADDYSPNELVPTFVNKKTKQRFIRWGAVNEFFDLLMYQSEYLFLPESYGSVSSAAITPLTVAERIRSFVDANGEVPSGRFPAQVAI